MGQPRWSPQDWDTHKAATATKTQSQIFTASNLADDLNPLNIKVRESVDSELNPRSTPIIIAVDETGSMGYLATEIIKNGLGVIMKEVYDRKPVEDPHMMCMAVGDAYSDRSPLQVTQFEASIVLADQVQNFFIEGNGGGNDGESYTLAWYFAAMKTRCDSQIKRGKKGFIFTIGDEAPHPVLTKEQIKRFIGDDVEKDFSSTDLLAIASQGWEIFHLVVRPAYSQAVTEWKALLGERAIMVDDDSKLAEIVVSTLEVLSGKDAAAVAASWSGDTSLVVANAIGGLAKRGATSQGVVRF